MTRNQRSAILVAAGLAMVLLPFANAHAIEVGKSLYTRGAGGGGGGGGNGPAPKNPLTPALQSKLVDTVSDESQQYLSDESEKKAGGQPYVDLDSAKMKYMPAISGGVTTVTCRLEAAEYKPHKDAVGKGSPTGSRKALVFKYRLDGQKWVEVDKPKWEDVTEATAKGKKGAPGGM